MDVILYFTMMKHMQIFILFGGICYSLYQTYLLLQAMDINEGIVYVSMLLWGTELTCEYVMF